MKMLELVIAILGGNAIMLLAIAFLAKALIAHLLKKDIDNYKSELKAKSDVAIEQLKNDLKIMAMEHEVKFTKLHENRANIIAELYSLLIESEYAMNGYISKLEEDSAPPAAEPALLAACQQFINTFKFINRNSIYLPEPICKSLDAYVKVLAAPALFHIASNQNISEDDIKSLIELWKGSAEFLKQSKNLIKDEMRLLLGDKKIIVI